MQLYIGIDDIRINALNIIDDFYISLVQLAAV